MSDVDTTTEPQQPTPDAKPDEPLGAPGIKALQEERDARKAAETASTAAQARIAELEAQIAGAKPDANLEQRLADLQSRLDSADAARAAAEAAAEAATVAQLRTDRAAEKGLPAALARKLDGTTAEEIDAEIDELLPLLQLGPRPNPQQGNPSQARGGSMSAGRERYAAKSN